MHFYSTKEVAEKWGVDTSLVLRLAREGRIEGAQLIGKKWLFPTNVKKPADGRSKAAKAAKAANVTTSTYAANASAATSTKSAVTAKQAQAPFRFPLYVNFDESTYYPPLSLEESQLRRAQIAFYACQFKEADALLAPLAETAKNRYVRMAALYHRCSLALYGIVPEFDTLIAEFFAELSRDFPYKREMALLHYSLETYAGFYKSMLEDFAVDPTYSYHPSAYYPLMNTALSTMADENLLLLPKLRYDAFEALCQQMEHEGCWAEAQELHYELLVVYQMQGNSERVVFHSRRGLEIAMENSLYWTAAIYAGYYPYATSIALNGFPTDFADTIYALAETLRGKFAKFVSAGTAPTYLGLLSSDEYEYAFLAGQGTSNRDIAKKLGISEKTVSKKYSRIYSKLGVKNKQELASLIVSTHRGGHLQPRV